MQSFGKFYSLLHHLLNSPYKGIAFLTGGIIGGSLATLTFGFISMNPTLFIFTIVGFIIGGAGAISAEV